MASTAESIMIQVVNYFRKDESKQSLNKVVEIMLGKSHISICFIEWFILSYSKGSNLIIYIDETTGKLTDSPKGAKDIHIYQNYKNQLKSYKKVNFDPFCRGEKIQFEYAKDKDIITSVRQLNFFRWLSETKILDYIFTNYEKLEIAKLTNKN